MKIKKWKEVKPKEKGIILFTILSIFLIIGVFFYQSFAVFQINQNQDLIEGKIDSMGDISFVFYLNDQIQSTMPKKESEYAFNFQESYCMKNGKILSDTKPWINRETWDIVVEGVTESHTKCILYFNSKLNLIERLQKIKGSQDLYRIDHSTVTGTTHDTEFQKEELRYANQNPNNYVWFNDELWRMVGLVNTPEGQRIKIVRNEYLSGLAWDSAGQNNWNLSSLVKNLNDGEYYYRTGAEKNYGLKDYYKNMIDKKITWNLGGIDQSNVPMTSEAYILERQTNVFQERPVLWSVENSGYHNGIGLLYPSDYGYTIGGDIRNHCVNNTKLSEYGTENCITSSWLNTAASFTWFLTPSLTHGTAALTLSKDGTVSGSNGLVSYTPSSKPALYLKEDIAYLDNEKTDGSENYPYILS